MRVGFAAAMLLLAGCAAAPAAVAPTESAGGTLGALSFLWQVIMQDEAPHASLMYAPRYSDHILVSLRCARGSGRVKIETFNPGTDGTKLALASGDVRETVSAERLPPDEFYGDAVVSVVEVAAAHPVLAAFRKNGSLATGTPPAVMSAGAAEEKGAIAEFFGVCG